MHSSQCSSPHPQTHVPKKNRSNQQLSRYGKLDKADEAGMMTEIFERGPITCGVSAPDDFVFKYHSSKQGGVYVDNSGA